MKKIKRRGFTLVEVLIVVVIIAILAALILPRLMQQSENAYLAEAQNMLGAMRRGQLNFQDLNETNTFSTSWTAISVNSPATTNWSYTLVNTGVNTAQRAAGVPTYGGRTITLDSAGVYGCGSYTPLGGGKGCKA